MGGSWREENLARTDVHGYDGVAAGLTRGEAVAGPAILSVAVGRTCSTPG